VKQGGDGRGVVGAPARHNGFDRAKQIVAGTWRGRLGAAEWEEGDKESDGEAETPHGNLSDRGGYVLAAWYLREMIDFARVVCPVCAA
jgi:hypothetical protein